jgi:hypothetical protein
VIRKLNPPDAVKDVILHAPISESQPKADPPRADTPTIPTVVFTAPSAPSTINHQPSTIGRPKSITLPASPKLPNLVTGVVVDQDNKLVENAIIQIVSGDGIPARAMKTNSLGQFYTSTPLGEGSYIIEIDKPGLSFSPSKSPLTTPFSPQSNFVLRYKYVRFNHCSHYSRSPRHRNHSRRHGYLKRDL